ncbi:MAG: hypothetical protein KJT03_12770, partial [Verrucomicrobiae bacterium]|nr:hypothetical protein [Verrucomicrobiae bacterium]
SARLPRNNPLKYCNLHQAELVIHHTGAFGFLLHSLVQHHYNAITSVYGYASGIFCRNYVG